MPLEMVQDSFQCLHTEEGKGKCLSSSPSAPWSNLICRAVCLLRFCWICNYFFFVANVAFIFISFTLHQQISLQLKMPAHWKVDTLTKLTRQLQSLKSVTCSELLKVDWYETWRLTVRMDQPTFKWHHFQTQKERARLKQNSIISDTEGNDRYTRI